MVYIRLSGISDIAFKIPDSFITLLFGGIGGLIFYVVGACLFKFKQIQTFVEVIRKK